MSTTPYDDHLDIPPFWAVQPVSDPDGTGADFAYTIGLSDRGFPELHLYSRPSLGEDPGLDWMFSTRDSVRVLNRLASMLVRGAVGVGSRLRREYDGGLSVVDFRVDPPEDPDLLEAYGVSPGAQVLPVRWSLSRAPEGPAVGVTGAAERRSRARYVDLLRRVDRKRPTMPGWELPADPRWDPDQRFGPMTPLVLARAAQMTQADGWTLGNLVMVAHEADVAAGLSWPRVRARALGRPVGRGRALDEVDAAAEQLVDGWSGGNRPTDRWRELVEVFMQGHDDPLVGMPVEYHMREMIVRAVRCCLTGEVVADLADPDLRLWAAGPWEAACAPDNRPGPEWHAAPPVLDRVRELLTGLRAGDLLAIGSAHFGRAMGEDRPQRRDEGRYAELRSWLTGWATVSAAGCPPAAELLWGHPAHRALRAVVARRSPADEEPLWGLEDWLTCLTSLLVQRVRMRSADVHTFAEPVAGMLPRLEERLNDLV